TQASVQASAYNDAKMNAQVTVKAVLCWSEYYNGKWQAAKTSDVNRPAYLGMYRAAGIGSFDRSQYQLRVRSDSDDQLGQDPKVPVTVFVMGTENGFFRMYNSHSLPLRNEDT